MTLCCWAEIKSGLVFDGIWLDYKSMLSVMDEKVGQLLEEAADQWGDREAVVSCQQGIRKTYSQVDLLLIMIQMG